jgi:UDP:flavonoid glycosyltransferase YjiC (YdhE family)
LNVERLASAIHHAVTDPEMRARAEMLGVSIREEAGLTQAIAVIEAGL